MNCNTSHRDGRQRPAADGLHLCHGCHQRLRQAITDLPGLDQDLELALIRAETPANDPVTHRKDPGLVLNQPALEARIAIRQQFAAQIRMVNEERGLTTWPQETILAMTNYMTRHIDWLAAHEAADTWLNEWWTVRQQARRAAHPTGIRRFELAPCIETDCPGTLIAILRPTDDLLPSSVSCDTNGEHDWQPHQWIALGRRIHGTPQSTLIRAIVA